MKSIDEAEAQARLDEILDEVQQQPIALRREGADIAVVLSMPEYERMRQAAIREFLALRNEIAREVRASGLTEARLLELLNTD
jgi:PHD/YefM family antitoxin component YafN of YafNO toxin-antitoxin module